MTQPTAGVLRHRLMLEARSRSDDEGGGAVIQWTTVAEVWGRIVPASGRELVRNDGVTVRLTHEVFLRHRADVLPEMRLRMGTRVFDIHVVIDIAERNRWLRCLCEETVA